MKVNELITALQSLPLNEDVLLNWEGELVPAKVARPVVAKHYSDSKTWFEDYYPDLEMDEDERRFSAVLID